MATEDSLETYTHLPLYLDPSTKHLSQSTSSSSSKKSLTSSSTSSSTELEEILKNINNLHTQFKSLETPNHAPPPPLPVNPKRTAQITKLRETAGLSARKNDYAGAVRLYGLAIEMASSRPPWEPAGLVREELATCYLERATAHVLNREWVEGWKDAESSTECKRGVQQGPQGQKIPGNPRGFVLGGKCLVELGRWDEAVGFLEKGIEVEGNEGPVGAEMVKLLQEAREGLEKKSAMVAGA